MKRYLFTVYLTGYGNNEDEAWKDATEDLLLDCDPAPEKDNWRIIDMNDEE